MFRTQRIDLITQYLELRTRYIELRSRYICNQSRTYMELVLGEQSQIPNISRTDPQRVSVQLNVQYYIEIPDQNLSKPQVYFPTASSKGSCSLLVSGHNLRADCKWHTLVLPLNSGANAALASVQALV